MLVLAFSECHDPDILRTYAADLAAAVGKWFGNAKQTANITPCAPALNFQPQQFLEPWLS